MEKTLTRAQIVQLIRKEIKSAFDALADRTAERQSEKLENAIGFRYYPPDPEIGDDEPCMRKK